MVVRKKLRRWKMENTYLEEKRFWRLDDFKFLTLQHSTFFIVLSRIILMIDVFLQCDDKRVSRKHGIIRITDEGNTITPVSFCT